jgi:hypothetical protein
MVQQTPAATAALYEADETAWLEAVADLVRRGQLDQVDPDTLAEYLTDMARRDRREVVSRLKVLLIHLLKWQHQPNHRSGSWLATILVQQGELRDELSSGTLRNHAEATLADAYAAARRLAAAETGLPLATFPETCGWDLDSMLADVADVA